MLTMHRLPANVARAPEVRDIVEDEDGLYLGDLIAISQSSRDEFLLKVSVGRNPRAKHLEMLLALSKESEFSRSVQDVLDELHGKDRESHEILQFVSKMFEEYHREEAGVQVYEGDPMEKKLDEFGDTPADLAEIIHLIEANRWQDVSPWSKVYRLFNSLRSIRSGA